MTALSWKVQLLEIGLLAIINAIKSNDLKCKGSHKEITFPQLLNKKSLDGFLPAREEDPLVFKFSWRGELPSAILERHVITTRDSVSEWSPDGNVTEAELLDTGLVFYQGYVKGKTFSFVALAVSSGLTGYIQVDREGLYIEPVTNATRKGTLGPHIVHSCGRLATPRHDSHTRKYDTDLNRRTGRKKRATPTRYLEVLLVADSKVVKTVGQTNIKTYLLTIMNIVNMLYHDDTLGNDIEVVTVKIKYLDEATEKNMIYTSDPKRTVDQFCHWASYGSGAQGGSNHDVAVLMTRYGFTPAGYAPITGMCVPMRNCALVKDDGFTSAFVVAHEIAHIFGLMHDGHGNTCYGREYATSLMATQVQSSFTNYWWSGCSKTRMAEVIGQLSCLNNNPHDFIPDRLLKPVGTSWTLDEQCRLEFGGSAKYCPFFGGRTPCTQLWCNDGTSAFTCRSKYVAPLDGTQCGPSIKWYCLRGECGYHGNEKAVDGGWGSWNSWSECSSKCGIGFKRRSRLCDKPEPKFNGKTCDGQSENTDTCKSKDCTEYVDMRAYQCSSMDSAVVNGVHHRWLPYQVNNKEDLCKLTCISETTNEVITFNTLVDNATPCSYDNPGGICINGKCETVGCDGVKGSSKREDHCGVCEGDGSTCKTVTGTFKKKFEYSAAGVHYEKVIQLPQGSRNISITERSRSPHFLSAEDLVYYREAFNGDGKQGRSKKFVLEGAWFAYENNAGKEALTSNGPLHNPVNILIYPMDWQKPAEVTYGYTVDKNDFTYEQNRYQWRFQSWSPCSVSCGKGVQTIIYSCYDKEAETKTDEKNCEHNDKPASDQSECERVDCNALLYGWRMKRTFTECTATCGDEGTRHRLYECELLAEAKAVEAELCSHIPEPIFFVDCNRFPCELPTFRWNVTKEWSDCSATCGDTGTQFQLFHCLEERGGKTKEVDNMFCSDIKSPKELRPCNKKKCTEYRWTLSENWFECNETCGDGGVQVKKAVCQKFVGGEYERNVGLWYCSRIPKPVESRECNRRPCYSYKWDTIEEWGACSHTCGDLGEWAKEVVCKNVTYDDRERRVDKSYCEKADRQVVIEPCNRVECDKFEWRVMEDWTPACQISCTESYVTQQTRRVSCYQIFYTGQKEMTDEEFCDLDSKPDSLKECEPIDCPMYEWSSGNKWSLCSATCGEDSTQTELIVCQEVFPNGTRTAVDDILCTTTKPVARTRACDVVSCAKYTENPNAPWSDCSVTCGTGIKQQLQKCVVTSSDGTEKQVPEENCRSAGLNIPTEPCDAGPCALLEWAAGPWSPCSRTCGPGKQKRIVICGSSEAPSHESMCFGKAPDEFQTCENEPCKERNSQSTTCRDRAPFCHRANERLCGNSAYLRVCCASCKRVKPTERAPRNRRRLRRLLTRYRARRRRYRQRQRRQ